MRAADGEFAVADAGSETFRVASRCVLAVGRDKLGQRGEQAGLGQAVTVDAVEPRFGPGFGEIPERCPSLFRMVRRWRDGRTWTGPHAHNFSQRRRARAAHWDAVSMRACGAKPPPFRKVNTAGPFAHGRVNSRSGP